jgi:2-polyprenyl-6-methoxyphenol hydroxylase-like FAD-dependent oxidoreductase
VVGADGVNSTVRDALGLLDRRIWERDGGVRVTIPRSAAEKATDLTEGVALTEAWSDKRRIIACPVTDDDLYLLLTCTMVDEAARATPINPAAWAKSFPSLRGVLQRAERDADWVQARWVQFQTIKLKRWSSGRVAVLGDAAHAMSPYLAQGAGHAMMNGLALAVAVSDATDIPAALSAWEKRERPLTEHTQRWTRIYGATMLLPEQLKQLVIRAEKLIPWVGRQYVRTANHIPTGTTALTASF